MKKFKNKKQMALSVVALILILLMTVGITYSWIDDIKLVQITTSDDAENTPLKTGVDINSEIKVTKGENTINLGNILADDDISYTDSEGKKQTKYEGGSHTPDWKTINEKKGYFYESGGMHLSGCYSDGETFKFPVHSSEGKLSGKYREGNKNDSNVNYIDFTIQVNSPDADVDFWFKSIPKIYEHGTTNEIDNARIAITVDGKSNVYSSDGKANTVDSNNEVKEVQGVRKTSEYTYGSADNTTEEHGKNSNFLFSIKKGDTVNLNVKIWLEDGFDTKITASDINLSLVSSWAYTRTLTIVDKTTSKTSASWIKDSTAQLYLVLPDALADLNSNIDLWDDLQNKNSTYYNENAPFYKMELISGSNDTYRVKDVPLVYNNEKMMIFRCTSNGWNTQYPKQGTGYGGDNAVQRGEGNYNPYCWNWWSTYTPNTYKNETYTIYGCSYDDVVVGEYGGEQTNKGYGTWGGVVEIKVSPIYNGTNYADGGSFFLRDFSDYDTSGETYIYTMYWDGSEKRWRAYAPKSSTLIHFYFHNGDTKRWWAYRSWNGNNPQVRPEGSETYYLTGISSSGDGYGYWENANNVYLIANGTAERHSTFYANMLSYKYPDKDWTGKITKTGDKTVDGKTFTLNKFDRNNADNGIDGYWSGSKDSSVVLDTSNVDTGYVSWYAWTWNNDNDGCWVRGHGTNASDITFDNVKNNIIFAAFNDFGAGTNSRMIMTKTDYTYGAENYKVYVSNSSQKASDWTNVKFDDGQQIYGHESAEHTMFPGCYFDWENNRWLGSLTGNDRVSSGDTGGDSGGDTGGDTGGEDSGGDASKVTTTMDGAGVYLYGSLDGKGKDQLCKMTLMSNGEYQAKLYLQASSNNSLYYIGVREASSSSSWQYYADSGTYKVLSDSMDTEEYNLNGTQPLYLRVGYTHTYTFTYTKNDHKIKITR